MTKNQITLALSLFICLLGFPAFGETIYALTEDADIQRRNDNNPPINVTGVSSDQLLAGCAGAVGQDRCVVIPLQLPNLGAVTNPFNVASLVFNYEGKNNTVVGNVDVYGLGRRAAPEVLIDDYWTAISTIDPTDATLLAQNVITANSTSFGLKTVRGSALVNFLNTEYAGGLGAGNYVFFRLSVDEVQTGGASRYLITSADGGTALTAPRLIYNEEFNPPSTSGRPFIWVRDLDKADILAKINSQPWAQSVFNGMVNRVAGEVSSHQSNRDSFLRSLPVLWSTNPPRYKTYPAYPEARAGSKNLFDAALDSAVLYYLTGDAKYARCAADILHNATKTILPLTPSTIVNNGGWVFSDTTNGYGLLYEARIMGAQLPVVYDFLHGWLQSNQVYDVGSGSMVNFSFGDAQEVFRTYYELTRDRGGKDTNWSALMASCMLHSLLALDDKGERDAALQVYLTTGSPRQASLDFDYRHYGEAGSVWPESLQYASAVGEIRSAHMVMIERYNPQLTLFESYPNFALSLPRIRDFLYPGGEEQISFGDGKRRREGESFFEYEMIYRHAKDRGYGALQALMGGLINDGIADNRYNRSSLKSYASLGRSNEPLQLLLQEPVVTEAPAALELPRTDELSFAGITLQRNESPNGDPNYGLMGQVGGAAYVHSHASGMAMELFGMGEVMGAKSGRDNSYQTTLQRKYYRLFASNNTVVVNGASIGDGGWQNLEINTVNTVSIEPQPSEAAVSSHLSFSTSSFEDNKGNLAEATQQRTLALVRTSDTSGFYVDLFRSDSTVTNRTATTLNGNVTDEYHDYIYRNIGDLDVTLEVDGSPLSLVDQPNRFQNDVGTQWDQPGWRYFSNTQVSFPHQGDLFAQFKATPSGRSSLYMSLHMPAVADREVAKVASPAIKDAPSPYDNRDAPTLVIRKIGEAWDKPFLSVFEPHFGVSGGTVQTTTALWRNDTVVGVKVESLVGGNSVIHYVFSNPNDNQTYTDSTVELSFQGRFGIVADYGGGALELYLGDGRSISYQGNSLTSIAGDTEASLVLSPGEETQVTSNDPVEIVVGVDPSPLVAHWPLDEGAGDQANNAAGTPFTATLENGATWGYDAEQGIHVVFDGEDDRISTSFTYAFASDDDFTWTWWANKADPAGTKSGSIMVGNRYGGGGSETLEFIKLTPSQGQFANTSSVSNIERYLYPSEITNNGWNHYAMVKSGTSYQWYVNGLPQGAPLTISYHETARLPFFIGGDGDNRPNEHFKGGIDDVALYRSALSQAEVQNVIDGIYLPIIPLTMLGIPVDASDGSVWLDGRPAHSGANYLIPANGNLRGESGNSVFPGASLTVQAGGRFQVRAIESEVATVDKLILAGGSGFGDGQFAELAAGTGTGVSNLLDGSILQSGATRLVTYGGTIARKLKILSRIEGDGRLQLVGEGAIIDNLANSFSGIWEVTGGSELVFENSGAVGNADLDVQSGGTLEIKGNWNQEASLTVANNSGTEIRVGPHHWTLASLMLGGTLVADGIYSPSELSALSSVLFSGTGRITVGTPLFAREVIAGWDSWDSNTAPTADVTAAGITATATASNASGNWSITDDGASGRGSSGDGTWGSFVDEDFPASTRTSGAGANMTATNGVTTAELVLTITNNGTADWELDAFHMDVVAFRPNAPRTYQLEVVGGDITPGVVFTSGTNEINDVGGNLSGNNDQHDEIDISLIALADSTLEAGGMAVIRISFSDGTGSGGGHHLFLDNVAVTGVRNQEVSELESWRLEYFGTAENNGIAGDDFDANSDGESNLLEFATGQNPLANTLFSTPLEINSGTVDFRYPRSTAALADGMIFTVEWSDTLLPGSWSSIGVVDSLDAANPGNSDLENRIATAPRSTAGKRFLRLKVTSLE